MTPDSKITKGAQTWLFPLPTVLIGAIVDGKANFMTVAWASIANAEPPMLCVAIRRSRHTRKGITPGGQFSVNIPAASQARQVDFCGIHSGAKVDKVSQCGFTIFHGTLEQAPLIRECPLNLECTASQLVELPTHSLIIADIVQSHVSESCMVEGKLDLAKLDPMAYLLPARKYARVGETVADAFSAGMTL